MRSPLIPFRHLAWKTRVNDMSMKRRVNAGLIRKALTSSGIDMDDEMKESSPEEMLRERIFKPYFSLEAGLGDVSSLIDFACNHVNDVEFASVIRKKIVKDLRSMADAFESSIDDESGSPE